MGENENVKNSKFMEQFKKFIGDVSEIKENMLEYKQKTKCCDQRSRLIKERYRKTIEMVKCVWTN